jgi:hypothetical protein
MKNEVQSIVSVAVEFTPEIDVSTAAIEVVEIIEGVLDEAHVELSAFIAGEFTKLHDGFIVPY